MATFNKIADQEVLKVSGKSASAAFGLNCGDIVSVTSAGVIASLVNATEATYKSNIQTALGNGYDVLMIALSDAIVENEGTPYKAKYLKKSTLGGTEYDVVVPASSDAAKQIAGYRVHSVNDIKF